MKKRKHRVVVEVTFSKPVTDREAVQGAGLLIERIDKDANPVWSNALGIYAVKLTAKSYPRVRRSDSDIAAKPAE